MPCDWEERDDLMAAATSCPMPDCGALSVAYRSTAGVGRGDMSHGSSRARAAESILLSPEDEPFQWAPEDWFRAKVHAG